MTRRRFATRSSPHAVPSLGACLDSQVERLPLELALTLATELTAVVADAHQQHHYFGRLDGKDFSIGSDGAVHLSARPTPGADAAADMLAVGALLYRLFTGLTPKQARVRLAVSPLHDVPAAALLNPALDDTLDTILSQLLSRSPEARPQTMRQVEAWLGLACDELGVEPSRAAVLRWAGRAPALHLAPPPPPRDALDPDDTLDDDDDTEAGQPWRDPGRVRFDAWALGACAFSVVAFAMAFSL